MEVTGRQNWIPTKNSFICSKHFDTVCFYETQRNLRKLHINSVPTIFLPHWAPDSGSGGSGGSGLGPGSAGMDCLQPLRCPPTTPGPFHYLISEQAKSLVALQELQHEVGALLEFRDLVIETFPNLRNKMAAVSSSPVTMTGSNPSSNMPIPRREWEPGIRVRRRIQHKESDNSPSRSRSNSHSGKQQPKSNTEASVVQDSGFSTETSSSKETHSASSTSGMQAATGKEAAPEAEDELWNLLDVIQRKGTKLRDEVEALQGALCSRNVDLASSSSDFHQQILLGNTPQDVINLRRERDILLEKLADMESENLAGRVQASRLRADLESLIATKLDLEEQLRTAITQKTELNARIHDLHMQFVKSAPSSPDSTSVSNKSVRNVEKPARRRRTLSNRSNNVNSNNSATIVQDTPDHSKSISNNSGSNKELLVTNFPVSTSPCTTATYDADVIDQLGRLNEILGHSADHLPKVRVPDTKKIAAILQENDPLILQRSLLTITVHNQALKQRLEIAEKLKKGLIENLSKARDQNEDLKFQLEEKNIELEGTRARVRMLERFQFQKSHSADDSNFDSPELHNRRLDQLSTPSMKAMIPLPLADETHIQNNSSTESAHDQKTSSGGGGGGGGDTTPRRKPSRIPLPGAQSHSSSSSTSSSRTQSKNASSLTRPGSAQSGSSLSGAKSATSIPGPRGTKTPRDSLTGRLRNDSLSKFRETNMSQSAQQLQTVSNANTTTTTSTSTSTAATTTTTAAAAHHTPGRSSSVCNKRDGLSRVRRASGNSSRGSSGTLLHDNETNTKTMEKKQEDKSSFASDNDNSTISDSLYSDSLDEDNENELDSINSKNSSHPIFKTVGSHYLWNKTINNEYFDSINSTECISSGSLHRCGEGLAECDSLEETEKSEHFLEKSNYK